MDVVGFWLQKEKEKILVFLSLEKEYSGDTKVKYSQLSYVLYPSNDGWCISNARNPRAMAIRDDIEKSFEFIKENLEENKYSVNVELSVDSISDNLIEQLDAMMG